MDASPSRPHRSLNQTQLEILLILYKFRFATVDLIARYQEKDSKRYTYERIKNLVTQKYIGRNYNKSYIIERKQATYFLLPKALRLLKNDKRLHPTVLHNIYGDRTAGQEFIDSKLNVFELYLKFTELAGADVSFYTKSELAAYESLIRPLPAAFLNFKSKPGTKQFFLEILDKDNLFFIGELRKRILQYVKDIKSTDWSETGTTYPALMVICKTPTIEKMTQRIVASILEKHYAEERFSVYTTTKKALLICSSADEPVWSSVADPDVPLTVLEL